MSGGEKSWRKKAYELARALGTSLGVLHGMTAVAVATVDLTKLSSLKGGLEIDD